MKEKTCRECGTTYPNHNREHFPAGNHDVCIHCSIRLAEERRKTATERRAIERFKRTESLKLRHRNKHTRHTARVQRIRERKAKAHVLIVEDRKARRDLYKETRKVNIAKRELAARLLAERHMLPFVMRQHRGYLPGWVHRDICERLEKFSQDVVDGKSPRLMLQMPPRHGKSLLASIYFPSWHLGRNPTHEVISASYSGSLAMVFSRKVRGLIRSKSYQAVFPACQLDKDNENAEGWMTDKGGGYVPAGVGGGITGKGAHVLIIDDPVKNAEEAESETTQEAVWDWYTSTAYTRLAPGGGVLIIQTRWSLADLSGRLEEKMQKGEGDEFVIVRYPAVAEEAETYRAVGDALHPERYPIEALRSIERAVGPRVWQALYQQNPVPDTGSYFTKDMFQWYQLNPPARLSCYSAWDLAIGKGDRNDFTVGVTVGVDEDDNMWVLDMRRGRWDSFEIVEQILDVQRVFHPVSQGIEKGQLAMAIGPYLDQRIGEERLYETNIRDLPPGRRDKEARARAIQGRMRQGRVKFPKDKPWLDELYSEMLRFPNGVHDDAVDALAWVGLMLQEMNAPLVPAEPEYEAGSWKEKVEKYVKINSKRGSMAA